METLIFLVQNFAVNILSDVDSQDMEDIVSNNPTLNLLSLRSALSTALSLNREKNDPQSPNILRHLTLEYSACFAKILA